MLESVSKRFGGVTALDGVSFSVERAEVHAIVGGNGAGKSSLMNLLAGVEQPNEGRILLSGQPFRPTGPLDAQKRGISTVFQELNLFPHRSITENLFLNRELVERGLLERRKMEALAGVALARVGLSVSPAATVSSLSMGERQLVEIARAFLGRSELVIFDEPNSALTDQESLRLFELIQRLSAEGVTVLYVSQRLEDVFALSDRISVLRDGRYQGTLVTAETEPGQVIAKMLGRTAQQALPSRPQPPADSKLAMRAVGLCCGPDFGPVDLSVRQGEIVGLAGLEGSGVERLFRLLFGLERASSGRIEYQGKVRRLRAPADAMQAGAALIPASRRDDGLMLRETLKKNAALLVVDRLRTRFGLIDAEATERVSLEMIERLGVVASSTEALVGELSGGNQQKVLLGRWLATDPKLLLLDDPTRGIDVGAKREIHGLCDRLARQGLGLLFSSSELDETLALCDRIVVVYGGRLVRSFQRGEVDKARLMQAMSGVVEA